MGFLLAICAFLVFARETVAADDTDLDVLTGASLSGEGQLFDTKTFDGTTLGLTAALGRIVLTHPPVTVSQRRYLSFEANTSGAGIFFELKNSNDEAVHEVPRLLVEFTNTWGSSQTFWLDLGPSVAMANDKVTKLALSDAAAAIQLRRIVYLGTRPTNGIELKFDVRRFTPAPGDWALPTPFLDLLPGLNFVTKAGAIASQGHIFVPAIESASAPVPQKLKGQPVAIDLRTSPHLALIYVSSMQYFVDVELMNRRADGSEQPLVQNVTVDDRPKFRITLPATGARAGLFTVNLGDSLVANLEDYNVRSIAFSDRSAAPSDLAILALGFSAERVGSESRLNVTFADATPHIYFYNGCLQSSDDLGNWSPIFDARFEYVAAGKGLEFFKTQRLDLPLA